MTQPYELYPKKHILPYDGMSITASIWQEAHAYPIQMVNAHQIFFHGEGILQGLDVIASDPASSVVFILPGVAVDSAGQMIVLPEPLAYDLGDRIEGALRLFLLHREVKVQTAQDQESRGPAYMQNEFVIVARSAELDVPCVELARIERKDAKSVIVDAEDPHAPQINSIDLRFRRIVFPAQAKHILAGVCYLGEESDHSFHLGLVHLKKMLLSDAFIHLVVDQNVSLNADILKYDLIYLVMNPSAKFEKTQAEIFQSYLQNGGKILVEFSAPPDDGSIASLFKPLGLNMRKVEAGNRLFGEPYLFIKAPKGVFHEENVKVWNGEDAILCNNGGYGRIWNGQAAAKDFSRSDLRDALEWGVNLIHYLVG